MEEIIDLVIIGGGPAGITAGIYAKRAGINFRIYEKLMVGGNITKTDMIENYPAVGNISGFELGEKMKEHALELGIKIEYDEILKIEKLEEHKFLVKLYDKEVLTKNIMLATGSRSRKTEYIQKLEEEGTQGISYCATCDGMFYNGKKVVILGAGNTGFEEAIFLSRICENVTILQHNENIKASYDLREKVKNIDNINIILNASIEEIKIDERKVVSQIVYKDIKTEEIKHIDANGIFVAIGIVPNSELLSDLVELDQIKAVVVDENMETNIKGIFAVGDVRNTKIRQVLTAMNDSIYAIEKISKEI